MITNIQSRPICAAIVVSYEPDMTLLRNNLLRIAPQVDQIFLIDNSTKFCAKDFCIDIDLPHLNCIPLFENLGVASALNHGISAAAENNVNFVLFLDQDSECSPTLINDLLDAYQRLFEQNYSIAAVGARSIDRTTNQVSSPLTFGLFGTRAHQCQKDCVVPVDFLISSGSLISMDTIQFVGGMREDLFIDHVDTEWILRAKLKGLQAYMACDAHIVHAIGERRKRVWVGRWRNAPLHKSFRYYYVYRNYLLLAKERYVPIRWKVMEFLRLIQMAIFIIFFGDDRRESFKYIYHGIADGLIGRSGRLASH